MNGNIKRLIVDRSDDGDSAGNHRYAAIAGVLCAGVSLCTLGSSIALESASAMTAIGLAAFGLLLSFLCFTVPWERVGTRVVDLAPVAATLAIAIATTTIDPTYGFYLVLVAAVVAYTITRPRVLGFHLGLIALALIAPIAFEPEGTRKAVACALIFGPGVILVTAGAVYVRRSGEARERAYREFANDALELASRIRSRVATPAGGGPVRAPEWIEAPAPVIPLRSVGIAKVVRAQAIDRAESAPALLGRLPMTAVAVAASVIAAVATTAAVVRDGGGGPVAEQASPALVRDAQARTVDDGSGGTARRAADRRAGRRNRAGGAPTTADAAAPAPAAAAPAPDQPADDAGGGAIPHQAAPPPSADTEAPVPVRPQAGPPESQAPVQQGAPAGPVDAVLGLVDETVSQAAPDLP